MNTRQTVLLSLSVLVLFTMLLFIVFSDKGLVDLYHLRRQKQVLMNGNEEMVRRNVELHRAVERLNHDLGTIENVARRELGMIGRNEVLIHIKDETP